MPGCKYFPILTLNSYMYVKISHTCVRECVWGCCPGISVALRWNLREPDLQVSCRNLATRPGKSLSPSNSSQATWTIEKYTIPMIRPMWPANMSGLFSHRRNKNQYREFYRELAGKRHDTETLYALMPLRKVNSVMDSPNKGSVMQSFDV